MANKVINRTVGKTLLFALFCGYLVLKVMKW